MTTAGPNTTIITGASRGLGLSLVAEFASRGWNTHGISRSDPPTDFPTEASYHKFDASDLRACQKFWAKTASTLGNIESQAQLCLVNNAGLYVRSGFLDTPAEMFEDSIRSNYLAAVHMTRTMADVVKRATIINIISTSAQQAKNTNSAYGSAKAGLAQFFRSLQQEFPASRYRITNLYPGTIRTHGEGPEIAAIEPRELSSFIRELAEDHHSFFVSEVTLLPLE